MIHPKKRMVEKGSQKEIKQKLKLKPKKII